MVRAFFGVVWDLCCAPALERWRDEVIATREAVKADWRQLKLHRSPYRRRPEKGILRLVLFFNWLGLNLYAVIILSLYHAFERDPSAALWWFGSTALAGGMYLMLMYGDPGFVDREMLLRLTENLQLGGAVVGSDVGRGLLQDVAGDVPAMDSILPATLMINRSDAKAAADVPPLAAAPANGGTRRVSGAVATADVDVEMAEVVPSTTAAAEGAAAARPQVAATTSTSEAPRTRGGPQSGRARVLPVGVLESRVLPMGMATQRARRQSDRFTNEEDGEEEEEDPEALAADLRDRLAHNPRMIGYDEEGAEAAIAEAAAVAEARRNAPLTIADFFTGYCDEADFYLPIRAKYCKKHGRVVAKFDHFCYLLGTSVGEKNHGRFYRYVLVQLVSIVVGKLFLVAPSYIHGGAAAVAVSSGSGEGSGGGSSSSSAAAVAASSVVWTVVNVPLLLLDILTWISGVPLLSLLLVHTFMCLTSSTTYEFVKLEKLEYMNGFYQFSFPFSDGLFGNIKHFCCPRAIKLWRRAPPEHEWPESFWRNRYYSCCG